MQHTRELASKDNATGEAAVEAGNKPLFCTAGVAAVNTVELVDGTLLLCSNSALPSAINSSILSLMFDELSNTAASCFHT